MSFTFLPAKFKFTCEYVAGVNLVRFVCRAYFVPEDGRTGVEFQRRAGCCIACAKVVEAIRATLLVREGNASAAPVAVKPFRARPLSVECAAHAAVEVKGEREGETVVLSAAEVRAVAAEQQCKLMEDLRACLTEGKDDVLTEFAQVLIPLSQLSPEHLLSDLDYADLLAALGGHASVDSARLAAMTCLANLAATCFAAGGSGGIKAPGFSRGVSSDEEDEEDEEAAESRKRAALASGAGVAAAEWFGRALPAAVRAVQADGNPHVRREACRALMQAAPGMKEALKAAGAAAALERYANDASDRLLRGYAQAGLKSLRA